MNQKLNKHQQFRIFQLCVIDKFAQEKVSRLYNVSQGTISNVIKRLKQLRKELGETEFIREAKENGVNLEGL